MVRRRNGFSWLPWLYGWARAAGPRGAEAPRAPGASHASFRDYKWSVRGKYPTVALGIATLSIILAGHFGSYASRMGENYTRACSLHPKLKISAFEEWKHRFLTIWYFPILNSVIPATIPLKQKENWSWQAKKPLLKGGRGKWGDICWRKAWGGEFRCWPESIYREKDDDHMPSSGKPQLTEEKKPFCTVDLNLIRGLRPCSCHCPWGDELRVIGKGIFFDSPIFWTGMWFLLQQSQNGNPKELKPHIGQFSFPPRIHAFGRGVF